MVIYPYKRLPFKIAKSVPAEWGIGLSDSGWMHAEVFYEYIGNMLHPYLTNQNTKFPVIIFVDGHCTDITYNLSELCTQYNTINRKTLINR